MVWGGGGREGVGRLQRDVLCHQKSWSAPPSAVQTVCCLRIPLQEVE